MTNKITYTKQGDYLLPNLKLPEQPKVEIGIWGCGSPVETSAAGRSTDRADRRDQRHLRYIKQHHKTRYTNLLTSCKLTAYLADIDE